ncbi:MAG: hypothetical protein OXG78_05105 [Chloroflexi bacterium]|nr:hypothetical protein [Chloroflexota bacterium]
MQFAVASSATTWGDSYQEESFKSKRELVSEYLEAVDPKYVWDLGANDGVFSRIASRKQAFTVSIDSDPGVVEANYIQAKAQKEAHLHPLLIDPANHSARLDRDNFCFIGSMVDRRVCA